MFETLVRRRNAPWYSFTGGLLGPVYVVGAILLSQELGFSTFQLCATVGQLIAALVVDAIGLVRRRPAARSVQ